MDKTQDVTSPVRASECKEEKNEDELTEDDDITLESSQAARDGKEGDILSQGHASLKESALAGLDTKNPNDALSQVASDAISNMPSQAPTEKLAQEYKRLMQEYDTICEGNKRMEDQIEDIKKHWQPAGGQ